MKMTNRLDIGEPVPRPQPGLQMISDRFLNKPTLGTMFRQQFRLRLSRSCKPSLDGLCYPPMKLAAFRLIDSVIKRFLEQRVSKKVGTQWRLTFDIQDVSRN